MVEIKTLDLDPLNTLIIVVKCNNWKWSCKELWECFTLLLFTCTGQDTQNEMLTCRFLPDNATTIRNNKR